MITSTAPSLDAGGRVSIPHEPSALSAELRDGETLAERQLRQPMAWRELLQVADRVLDLLKSTHEHGVFHRDLRPENIFLARSGKVRLLNFEFMGVSTSRLPGAALSRPAFMPPELAQGRLHEVDAQSDLWALGATMFWVLAGRPVRVAATLNEERVQAMTEPPISLSWVTGGLPPRVGVLVDRALSFYKEYRWSDARAMQVGSPGTELEFAL